ncbi:MAG: UDP-N-acetylmuramoyl-tripeptide--D-alanyl-D-alanine ligase [Magnetococcales bacterium]|nr:UDP-N-acetylmuramoyl-tripeptide--D-alanyl-D-alanine ligase [Magnetococcales bacterium]
MSLATLLAHLKPLAETACGVAVVPPSMELPPACTLFFSLCDGVERAQVLHVSASDFNRAWQAGAARCMQMAKKRKRPFKWLRVEWVTRVEATTWEQLDQQLRDTRRTYFRQGLAFDPQLKVAFLEQELNANAMLYADNAIDHAQRHPKHFATYAAARYGKPLPLDFAPQAPVYPFTTTGLFCEKGREPCSLIDSGLAAGRRLIEPLSAEQVLRLIESGSEFLARQVQKNGQFVYGYFPCFDRLITNYNALRHASSLYAMLECWELTQNPGLKGAIEAGLTYLTQTLIRHYTLPGGVSAAFVVEADDEIKLGANAVALLALVKYDELTGDSVYRPLMESLALGIAHLQNPATGQFNHVLQGTDLTVKEAFRIIYYDGEAAFGLMRLYGLTGDGRWLAIVERAFDYFLAANHWQSHDHWLSYCVNELTRHRPEEKYFRFGLQNIADHLDFILERETVYPTLLELAMATEQMLSRLAALPAMRHLLQELDLDKFYRALEYRARHLLDGFFWPEFAMYFKNPARIVGSFFIRHHAFRVRIDDVEHYLSGYVAYWKYLQKGGRSAALHSVPIPESATTQPPQPVTAVPEPTPPPTPPVVPDPAPRPDPFLFREGPNWTAARLLKATGGRWLRPPLSRRWMASGLCIWAPSMQPGQMVVLRPENSTHYLTLPTIEQLPFMPQAVITSQDELPMLPTIPVLRVAHVGNAILKMGRFARQQMRGKVIGVTGSAGKTTLVALLEQLLRSWGGVGQTAHNANLPAGIAWNLASIPWGVPHSVIEMAIGSMAQNAAMVQPHVAVVTNIAPAHLEFHGTMAEVARKKSFIFNGMPDDGSAILNRDMAEWETVYGAAQARGLRIIRYGQHPESEVRLLDYEAGSGQVRAELFGRLVHYRMGAAGLHMAMNSLACLATLSALGLALEPAMAQFALFRPVAGRGESREIQIGPKRVLLVDESYNANPVSMQAAIQMVAAMQPLTATGRRVLILGEMLQLGAESGLLHAALLPYIVAAAPGLVLLCGAQMVSLFDLLPASIEKRFYPQVAALNAELLDQLVDGDLVLVKSSNATGLKETVQLLREHGSATA